MAQTTSRKDPKPVPAPIRSPIVLDAAEQAMGSLQPIGLVNQQLVDLVFKTVAKECQNGDERTLYLQTCKANGLNPLKKELYATRRKGALVFITAYTVFVSRCTRMGFIVHGEAVCEGDVFEGWDAVKLEPIKHVIPTERGNVLAAYGWVTDRQGVRVKGNWWPWRELVLDNQSSPTWKSMPVHMSRRIPVLRLAREICPDLASLYGAEEMVGELHPGDAKDETETASGEVPTTPETSDDDNPFCQHKARTNDGKRIRCDDCGADVGAAPDEGGQGELDV